jgi:hypothetical protein
VKPAIDVCGIVTPAKAKAALGDLGAQPPAKTDHVGFGVDSCMYLGPTISGAGAQTIFSRLTVQAGTGKDGPDMLQADVDKRNATSRSRASATPRNATRPGRSSGRRTEASRVRLKSRTACRRA